MLLVGCAVLLLSVLRCTSSLPVANCSEIEGPCWCQNERIYLKVHCEAVNSEIRFHDTLSEITVEDDEVEELQPEMFKGICVKRLILQLSELKRINESTFEELKECLVLLLLMDGKLSKVPINALKNLNGLRVLSLAGNEIRNVPSLRSLPLHHLSLASNKISSLPKDTFPPVLKTLSVTHNQLKTLNESMLHLKDLAWLFVSSNWLTSLSGELTGMKSLEMLSASNNNIKDLGDSFKNLKKLKYLHLDHNLIRKLRNGLHSLFNLRSLNLSFNFIRKLYGKEFINLLHLETLDLSHNQLESVGDTFKYTRKLETLILSANKLYILGSSIRCPDQLGYLDLSKNYLTDLDWLIQTDIYYDDDDANDNDIDPITPCENRVTVRRLFISGNPMQCHSLQKVNATINKYKIRISGLPTC
ncbi:leucine-rich repeat-containing protein let-4-like [Centruroides vittatus]|uniref:leucine-rich repeat-containing protein let-4-like n=1 Tax=Centruroides vittatus TaxID=120091 RepID=UPI003510637F